MTRPSRILLVLTSFWFLPVAALGTRVTFILNQQRKIPHQILASVPFEQETGNIAFALSQGKGFGDLFRQNTGPSAWLPPVYPFLLSLIFRIFAAFTISSFLAPVILNALFSPPAPFPLYILSPQVAGLTPAAAPAWVVV